MIKKKLIIKIVAIILIGILLAGCKMLAHKNYFKIFGRVEEASHTKFTSNYIWSEIDQDKYSREEFFFYSGTNKLQGFLYGATHNKGLVVISQGLGGTADSYFPLIIYFVDHGWRVFAFNNTGVSGSEGDGTQGLYQSAIDLDAALTFIEKEKQFSSLPVMLLGHSWGGFAVCAVLNYPHQVNAVVSFAGYNSGRQVLDEIGFASAGKKFNMVKSHLRKIETQRFGGAVHLTAVDGINKTNIPVMIIQCVDDDFIRAETTSIYAHREKITNPNVQIIFKEGEDASGHNRVWASKEQQAYMKWVNTNWKAYYQENNKNVSLIQWAEEVKFDKKLANELDASLMQRINEFFEQAR
jgi:pimeloyl-ACP methyl ester carboxylesterase